MKWSFEEEVLLVNLFFYTQAHTLSQNEYEIARLSARLSCHAKEVGLPVGEKFRNIAGIKMKLQNLEYIASKGTQGLSSYSTMDQTVYQQAIKKDSDIAKRLTDSIKRFFLNDEWENFSILFGLSSDEERQVLSVIERINSTSRDSIEKYKKRINASVARSKQIRFTIQSSSIEDEKNISDSQK